MRSQLVNKLLRPIVLPALLGLGVCVVAPPETMAGGYAPEYRVNYGHGAPQARCPRGYNFKGGYCVSKRPRPIAYGSFGPPPPLAPPPRAAPGPSVEPVPSGSPDVRRLKTEHPFADVPPTQQFRCDAAGRPANPGTGWCHKRTK